MGLQEILKNMKAILMHYLKNASEENRVRTLSGYLSLPYDASAKAHRMGRFGWKGAEDAEAYLVEPYGKNQLNQILLISYDGEIVTDCLELDATEHNLTTLIRTFENDEKVSDETEFDRYKS